jgi:hypothetical protein
VDHLKKVLERLRKVLATLESSLSNQALYHELEDGLRRLEECIYVCDAYLAIQEARQALQTEPPYKLARNLEKKQEALEKERTEVAADALYLLSIIESAGNNLESENDKPW